MRGAGKARGSLYRGGPAMYTWILHRITGVLIFCFLFAHILDTAMVRIHPDVYDGVIEVYHHPIIKLMELGLVIAVLFHALNGMKIIAVDFWSKGPEKIRQLEMATIGLFLILSAGATFAMGSQLIHDLGEDDEPAAAVQTAGR